MSPERRSTAPAALFRDIAREDMRESQQCKADGCHQQINGRVRVGGTIRALCTGCLAAQVGVSEAAIQRASGSSFKRSEGGSA